MTTHTKNMYPNPAAEIWIARLDHLRIYRACLQTLLTSAEQIRAQRYLQQDDRDRYLGGRALVKLAAGKMTGVLPEEISIITAATGKPSVSFVNDNIVVPAISISHAGQLVVVALQYGAELGVDVELFNHDVNLDDLMGVVCSKEEIAEINLADDKTRRQKFYEFWVLKEAYLKATGEGLSADARKLVFSVDAVSKVSLLQAPDNSSVRQWEFLLRQYDEKHLIALANQKPTSLKPSEKNTEKQVQTLQDNASFKDALSLFTEYCENRKQ
ncbi:4'-phosphopantetheinyl transferase family protein [Undibacterium sp. TC9W]|uniref:4'-phosphopantetheinyl transferase family protein n=1 Tax=Undibacterium sp. TC9W TaxID=3413053 RepID=UPI003BF43DF4